MVQCQIVSFIFITWRRLEKHINYIVFLFHQLRFMFVIQLSYSDSEMPVKRYYYSHMSLFWIFCMRVCPLASRMNETHSAWECSALRDDMNKTHPKWHDYLFSFNLNLDLLTMALENLYFNTLDWEKVQGKCLACIKSRGDHLPRVLYIHATGSHCRGMKEPHAAREPRVADPCPRPCYIFFLLSEWSSYFVMSRSWVLMMR